MSYGVMSGKKARNSGSGNLIKGYRYSGMTPTTQGSGWVHTYNDKNRFLGEKEKKFLHYEIQYSLMKGIRKERS